MQDSEERETHIEKVYDGHKCAVEKSPDDVEFPLEAVDSYWCDFDDHEVEDPVWFHVVSTLVYSRGNHTYSLLYQGQHLWSSWKVS